MAQKWYAFKNASDKSGDVELFIYNDIGSYGIGADDFAAELRQHKGKHVHLRINSLGGEVTEGNGIYNALSRHKGGVTVHIDGIAASMASVIAMAGKPVRMAENAILMIHNPWTMAAGESSDLRKHADVLDMMKEGIVNAYQKKTGLNPEIISAMMDEEKWLKAEEAVELGFADVIEEGFEAAASIGEWRSRFDTYAKAMSQKAEFTEIVAETAPVVEPAAEISVDSVTDAPAAEPVVEAAPETPAAEPEAVPAPEAVEPEALAEVVTEPVAQAKATDILNKYNAAVARAEAAEAKAGELAAEVASVKAVLDAERSALEALERSLGLAAAKVEPLIKPNAEVRASLLEQFEAISDPAEKARFYAKNRKGILASV